MRQLTWDENVLFEAERCMKIRVGQTVTFVGDFASHPLEASLGDSPSPIAPIATFADEGVFGFICPVHPLEMYGAIWVVP
jgi:plastocyanin